MRNRPNTEVQAELDRLAETLEGLKNQIDKATKAKWRRVEGGIRKEQSKSPGHPDNHALNPSDPEEESLSFQQQALLWTESTFGPESITPRIRALRFLEEALELVQSIGVDASDAATILSYVYGREPGRPDLEIGGVMLTLGALSEVLRVSMDDQAERELSRVRADTEAIKLRDQAKPKLHMLGEGS